MPKIPKSGTTQRLLVTATVALCGLVVLASLAFAYRAVSRQRVAQRGIAYRELPALTSPADGLYGVNIALEQYPEQDLPRMLSVVRAAGFTWVRQAFPWAEIESQSGQYEWARWDRLVEECQRQGLHLIAVLDTSPTWARRPVDRDNPLAPPQIATTFGLFARALAQRYAGRIDAYQIWDQPNIHPNWGAYDVDPAAYVHMLRIASGEIKRAAPGALVLSAALAPNVEPGGRNMSDVLYLRAMYQAGVKGSFDVLAAKAYGFWSGPEDRRVDAGVLNLSRLILLREEMTRQGDADRPMWAVEFGWNALPADWSGQPSPWGTDDAAKQADRTLRAVQRMRQEWSWLGILCAAQWQPARPADDPAWGFALLGPDSRPTPFYQTWQAAISTPVVRLRPDATGFYATLAGLAAAALAALIVLAWAWPRSAWEDWLAWLAARYRAAPEWLQFVLLGLLLAAYYWMPSTAASLALLVVVGALVYLRLDLGLAFLVFSIPFFLLPKSLAGKSFSMVETLTWLCAAAWAVARARAFARKWPAGPLLRALGARLRAWLRGLTALDAAALALVPLGALSLFVSTNRGVSLREWRVIIIEPVLLYLLLRQSRLSPKSLLRLADALLLAGVVVSFIGLWQYAGYGDVIITEGVRRVHSVYASPNNLSLLLGRILPLAIAMLVASRGARRYLYGLASIPLTVCQFLTYSRGGWLLALSAALLTIGLLRGKRAARTAVIVLAVCVLAILPLLGTQRLTSLLDTQEGTTFRRLRLWQAAVNMLRDYPITGIGLDNFLYRYPEYMLSDAWQEPGLSHPHNLVLDWWLRLGIGGVLLLVALVVAFFALALRLYRSLPDGQVRAIILGWIASMAGALAHGLIDNSYFLVDLAFVFFLSLGWVRAIQLHETTHEG